MPARPLAAALVLLPTAALAHTGHDAAGGFFAGLAHPVGGADHLLAMVAVGLLAAAAGGRAVWAMPAAFVAGLIVGAGFGRLGVPLPAIEPTILASVVLLGAALALALRPPLAAALPVLAAFGLAHGFAHGAEGPAGGFAPYALGFGAATAALHAAGIGLGQALRRPGGAIASRLLGGAAAAAGLALAVA
jgi:urease accessory protein